MGIMVYSEIFLLRGNAGFISSTVSLSRGCMGRVILTVELPGLSVPLTGVEPWPQH